MTVLLVTHPRYLDHETGAWHPERPPRIGAVLDGIVRTGLDEDVVRLEPTAASRSDLERVHPAGYLDALERFCAGGGGDIDGDTVVVPASWDAAVLAAGAGLTAIAELDRGAADAAFCAVRPPGHHATPDRAMGFCLLSNVAIAAAALADRGERVLVVDYDAHHGNGTQAAFEADPRVLYVSFHEYPLYPGTGGLLEVGTGAGRGTTINFPLPAGTTGDVLRAGIDVVVRPKVAEFDPTWLIISAGFDAHRDDPLTSMGLTSGDYADLTRELVGLVPKGRCLTFLEGGYDLDALSASTAACVGALGGVELHPEPPTSGGPGRDVVDEVAMLHLS